MAAQQGPILIIDMVKLLITGTSTKIINSILRLLIKGNLNSI